MYLELVRRRKGRLAAALALGLALAGGAAGAETVHPVAPPERSLGEPVEVAPEDRDALAAPGTRFGAQSLSTLDPFDRLSVVDTYHCDYLASEGFLVDMDWDGDVGLCDAGTVSQTFHDDTLRRIHYFRAMTGLPGDVTFDATKNAKAQEAALIMSANCGLSHAPIAEHPGWSCLSADGDEAAGASNLALGNGGDHTGPDAVNGLIEDAFHAPVGHRRWLLHPPAVEMGNGGIPWIDPECSAAAIWVIGSYGPRPPTPEWVAWPNAGFVPHHLAFDRWSFSLVGADFDTATVTMTHDGGNVPLTVVHPTPSSPAAGFGDPAIVWEPTGIPATAPTGDATYQVTVSGIAGAAQSSYGYDVTLIDANDAGLPLALSGTTTPTVGVASPYSFAASGAPSGYTFRSRTLDATPWTEGAEPGDPNLWLDDTDASYDLVTTALAQTGTQSFHLAFPDFSEQVFEIDRDLLPEATSELGFAYRRRFSSTQNEIAAEVSTNGGLSWSSVWSTTGVCAGGCGSGDWDASWLSVSVPLAAWADTPIRVRFVYRTLGATFLGTSSSYGVFFDGISVSDAGALGGESLTPVSAGATEVDWTPPAEESYLLDLRGHLTCHDSAYGPPLEVTAMPEPHAFAALAASIAALTGLARGRRGRARCGRGAPTDA